MFSRCNFLSGYPDESGTNDGNWELRKFVSSILRNHQYVNIYNALIIYLSFFFFNGLLCCKRIIDDHDYASIMHMNFLICSYWWLGWRVKDDNITRTSSVLYIQAEHQKKISKLTRKYLISSNLFGNKLTCASVS